jgi:putative chitinase
MKLTLEQLKLIMPRMERNPKTAASILPHLQFAMDEAGINSKLRIAAWLAQLAHESGEFRYMEELADGSAYENRADLGNTLPAAKIAAAAQNSTPGKFYKGRGPIQLTRLF